MVSLEEYELKRIEELKCEIDALTDSIALKISQSFIDELDRLLESRHQKIVELISLHHDSKASGILLSYLDSLRSRDRDHMQSLVHERDNIKETLLKINKIRQYID